MSVDTQAGHFQQLGNGVARADPHFVGAAADGGVEF
jgi:hypothetical protein